MAYNPYKDVEAITKLKASWHNAKEQGKDPAQYQKDAVQYYNNLRNNGQDALADTLTLSDYEKASSLLGGLTAPKPYDDWYDSITSRKIEEASKPVVSETADRIFSAYDRTNNLLNGEVSRDRNGNVVSGLNVDHYNTGKNQLGYINNYDITAQPWYDDLMAGYNLKGSDASKGALASGASSNAGNIDSYAAANAARQQLAFTNAGNEAARAVAAQNLAAWQNLYDSMTGHLGTMGEQANDALNIGAQIYQADSAERQNALNQAAGLEAQRMQNYINEYMAGLEADTEKYGADRTLEGTKYTGDMDLKGAQYAADRALEEAYAQASADRYKADRVYESDMEQIAAAQKAAENGENDAESIEAEPLNGLYADLHELYNMFRSKQNGITTLSDVYQAAVGLHPEYELEIRNYINNLNKLSSGTSGFTLNTGN